MLATEERWALAYQIVEQRHTVEHEVGHAAAAVVLGFDLIEVHANRPSAGQAGRVRALGGADRPRDWALMLLAGPLTDPGEVVPRWPLLDDEAGDEAKLKAITDELGYGRKEWDALNRDALALVARDDFNRAATVLRMGFDHYPVLDGAFLRALIDLIPGGTR